MRFEDASPRPAADARLLVAAFAVVVVTDQAAKWWAWRHVDGSLINSGGFILLGPVIRAWFAGPVSGAVSDVVGGVVLIAALWWLCSRPRSPAVLVTGGLVIAGMGQQHR